MQLTEWLGQFESMVPHAKYLSAHLGCATLSESACLLHAYSAVCIHSISDIVLLYAKGTTDLVLFCQVFAMWEQLYLL